jgi:hypothetical protein
LLQRVVEHFWGLHYEERRPAEGVGALVEEYAGYDAETPDFVLLGAVDCAL